MKPFDETIRYCGNGRNWLSVLSPDEWAWACATPTDPLTLLDYAPHQQSHHDDE